MAETSLEMEGQGGGDVLKRAADLLDRLGGHLVSPAGVRWAALLVIALMLFAPAQTSLPVTDRDEARFVQASRQMVQSGDSVDIRFQEEARHKKPVGIYWAQSLAALASGQGAEAPIGVYRMPSFLGAVAAMLLTAALGVPLIGARRAVLAALLVGSCLVLGAEARIAKTDALLLALVVGMQAVLARLYLGGGTAQLVWVFWALFGVSVLVKGPIGPLAVLPGIALLAVMQGRAGGWHRRLWRPGPILLAGAIVLPWLAAITVASDGAFWRASVGEDLLAKAASGQEGKGAPPGTHFALLWVTFWPASVLAVFALARLRGLWRSAPGAFLLALVVPFWLVFELTPTKLLHYTLPVLPALALLSVQAAHEALPTAGAFLRGLAGLALLPGLGLGAAALTLALAEGGGVGAVLPLGAGLAGALGAGGLAVLALWQRRPAALCLALALSGGAMQAGMLTGLARLPALWPTPSALALAEGAMADRDCAQPLIIGRGYSEPSLVWHGGRETLLLRADAPLPDVTPCTVLVQRIAGGDVADLPGWTGLGTVRAFALGAGRWVTLAVLTPEGDGQP